MEEEVQSDRVEFAHIGRAGNIEDESPACKIGTID
jgi:hypothetical protein